MQFFCGFLFDLYDFLCNNATISKPMAFQNYPSVCPICKEGKQFLFIRDFQEKEHRYSLYQCLDCQVQFWEPMKNFNSEWYEDNNPYKIRDILVPKIFRGYHKSFLKKHNSFSKGTKILDLGCCTGEFLFELEKRGCQVRGVDSDKEAIRIAQKYFSLKRVFAMTFEEFFQKKDLPKFDIITFFEVIQYLDDPLKFIESAKNLLKPNGTIVLSIPCRDRMLVNSSNWDFPHTGSLTRWNTTAVLNLFQKYNFTIVSVEYLEQFKILSEAFSGKLATGLVNKSIATVGDKKTFIMLPKIIYFLGRFKYYIVSAVPAFFLWFMGKITKRNNGIMLVELQ